MAIITACHCGAITLVLMRPVRKLTQCNCSICRRYGALWAYQQRKAVKVTAAEGALKAYSWGERSLIFQHCATCGCVTHYERVERKPDGSDMAGINMRNVVDAAKIAMLPIRLLDGDGSWEVLDQAPQPHLLISPSHLAPLPEA